MTDKNLEKLTEQKLKQAEADNRQSKEIQNEQRPASDVYSEVENKDPQSGVEQPTERAVEEAKEWVDKENQR